MEVDDDVVSDAEISRSDEQQQPIKTPAQELAEEYGEIATLAASLDSKMGQFVGTINTLVGSIPSHDALAAIWDEKSKQLVATETAGATTCKTKEDDILGDEAGADDIILL